MYLEGITNYQNKCYPQFTPINYLFDTKSLTDDEKSLILSELPAIFRKHNIPLNYNDILLYLAPYNNIATVFDISKILNTINSKNETERKHALLTKDFVDFYRKITSYQCDKLIEKAIKERYKYPYDKYDYNRFDKFKKYLNDNIPANGYFNILPLTVKDFIESKMDHIDFKEQRFRDYFHTIKSMYPNITINFLSERYFRLYNILKEKYQEISLDKISLDQGSLSISKRITSLYVNDIFYEKGPKHLCRNYLPSLLFNPIVLCEYPEQFRKYFSLDRYNTYLKELDKFNKKPLKISIRYTDNLGDIINHLEAERVILERNNYQNALSLLPILFQEYFYFSLKYEEELSYFRQNFSKTSDKYKSLQNMINKFGKENLSSELITYLKDNQLIQHNPIRKIKIYK